MDELTLDGKIYWSSKKAATVTGYAKDYVGQLCREGRVEARLVGRSWYVYEPSIMKHRFAEKEENQDEIVSSQDQVKEEVETKIEGAPSEKANDNNVWDEVTYTPEVVQPLKTVSDHASDTDANMYESVNESGLSDMQDAWKEWFEKGSTSSEKQEMEQDESKETSDAEQPILEEKIEPVSIHIVHTEAPKMTNMDIISHENIRLVSQEPKEPLYVESKIKVKKIPASNVVLKALLVSFIVLSVAITTLATGGASSLTAGAIESIPFIDYLSGETKINR